MVTTVSVNFAIDVIATPVGGSVVLAEKHTVTGSIDFPIGEVTAFEHIFSSRSKDELLPFPVDISFADVTWMTVDRLDTATWIAFIHLLFVCRSCPANENGSKEAPLAKDDLRGVFSRTSRCCRHDVFALAFVVISVDDCCSDEKANE